MRCVFADSVHLYVFWFRWHRGRSDRNGGGRHTFSTLNKNGRDWTIEDTCGRVSLRMCKTEPFINEVSHKDDNDPLGGSYHHSATGAPFAGIGQWYKLDSQEARQKRFFSQARTLLMYLSGLPFRVPASVCLVGSISKSYKAEFVPVHPRLDQLGLSSNC